MAASGGQGGPGGLRFPPRPSLDSPLPLETPPLRYGAVAARAGRCAAGAGSISALRRISAVVWEAAGAGRCAAGAGMISALRLCAVLPRESARGPSGPLALYSNPAACTPGSRQFLRRGACPPEKKLLPCRFAVRALRAQANLCRGGSGGGACSPATYFILVPCT